MIGQLQRKFILISMFIIIIVTNSIYGLIAFENYRIIDKKSDIILNLIIENDGKMPKYETHKKYDNFITKEELRIFLILLNPLAPHITSELYEIVFGGNLIDDKWPEYDESKLVEDSYEMVVA